MFERKNVVGPQAHSDAGDDGAISEPEDRFTKLRLRRLQPRRHGSCTSQELYDAAVEDILERRNEKSCLPSSVCSDGPITNADKMRQQAKMMLLILLPITTLLSVALYMNTDSIFAMIQAQQTKSTVEFSVYVGRLVVVLQKEQDQSVLYLSSIGPETKFFLAQTYLETDLYIDELPYWPGDLDRSDRSFFSSKQAFKNYLAEHRNSLGSLNVTMYAEILFYKNTIDVLLIWLYDALKESRYSNLWKTLVAYQKVIFCEHYAGIERALGTTYFVEGGFSDPYLYIKYNEVVYVFENNFQAAMKYSPLVRPISEYETKVNGEYLTDIIKRYRDQIQFQNISGPSLPDAASWFDYMSTYLDVLFNFQTDLAEDILLILKERSEGVLTDMASSTMVIFLVLLTLPATLRALYRLGNDIQSYALALASKTKELRKEQRKMKRITYKIIPESISENLQKQQKSFVDFCTEVTVFYSEIHGYHHWATDVDPHAAVILLHDFFATFNVIVEKHQVHPVISNVDSFLIVSGLPQLNKNSRVVEIADMALELRELMTAVTCKSDGVIYMTVGIHTGRVVSGAVMRPIPSLCVLGEATNAARSLQRSCIANGIHVGAATYNVLLRHGYKLKPRVADKTQYREIHTHWLVDKPHNVVEKSFEKDRKATTSLGMGIGEYFGRRFRGDRAKITPGGIAGSSTQQPEEIVGNLYSDFTAHDKFMCDLTSSNTTDAEKAKMIKGDGHIEDQMLPTTALDAAQE